MTDDRAAQPCDLLFREYVAWVADQLWLRHGVPLDDARSDVVHAGFRAEWPKLFGSEGRMYLATVDGRPAGVGALKPVSSDEAEMKRVYVRPDHRGLGLGRRLAQQIVDDARLLGHRAVRLETFDFMTDAHSLYGSLGFVETAPFEGSEAAGHGVDVFELFMTLDLRAT